MLFTGFAACLLGSPVLFRGRHLWLPVRRVVYERGQLKAQRLAATGRQYDDRIAPGQHRVDCLALQRSKRGIAPDTLKDDERIGHGLRDRFGPPPKAERKNTVEQIAVLDAGMVC